MHSGGDLGMEFFVMLFVVVITVILYAVDVLVH